MKLTLYYAPSTCALVPYVTLTEAGADFEVRKLNFRAAQHMTPDYLAINPLHKVPVLEIDGGERLTENVAIQLWISRAYPAARLLPTDPLQEVKAISIMAWCASGIHPHLTRINSPSKFCDAPGSEASIRALAVKPLLENFAAADKRLAGRDFFFDHFTAADAHFFWTYRRASQFDLPLGVFANCNAHFARMLSRASVQKVLAFEKETLDGFSKS